MGKGSKTVRTANKKSKKKAQARKTTVVAEHSMGYSRLTEYDDVTGEIIKDDTMDTQAFIELCRGGDLPQSLIDAAETKLYGKRGVPQTEDYNHEYIFDPDRKSYRRRTAFDPPYNEQTTLFDPVAFETEIDITPWEDPDDPVGGNASGAMTAQKAADFVRPKPVVNLLGYKLDGSDDPRNKHVTREDFVEKIPVRVMPDESPKYPDLCLQVYIEADNPCEEAMFIRLFSQALCQQAKTPLEADVVLFGGGADVDPALYGASKHDATHFDPLRDSIDMDLYNLCLEHGVPMIGVCRGAQFLHVMQGGQLYQDVDKHKGPHNMYDICDQKMLNEISSSHHQMCMHHKDMVMIGVSHVSTVRYKNNLIKEMNAHRNTVDIEAFFYRDPCVLGVQGHPEYHGYPEYSLWFLKKINEYINLNPDIDWVEQSSGDWRRRLKPEFVEEAKRRRPTPKSIPKREILRIPGPVKENK